MSPIQHSPSCTSIFPWPLYLGCSIDVGTANCCAGLSKRLHVCRQVCSATAAFYGNLSAVVMFFDVCKCNYYSWFFCSCSERCLNFASHLCSFAAASVPYTGNLCVSVSLCLSLLSAFACASYTYQHSARLLYVLTQDLSVCDIELCSSDADSNCSPGGCLWSDGPSCSSSNET